jgi:hypothetical protein
MHNLFSNNTCTKINVRVCMSYPKSFKKEFLKKILMESLYTSVTSFKFVDTFEVLTNNINSKV